MNEYPKPKIIVFDGLAIAAFLLFGLDALVHLLERYVPTVAVFFSEVLGEYSYFLGALHFWTLIVVFVLTVLATWGLIVKQVFIGWAASTASEKVMPYGQLRLLFVLIFGGITLFFYLGAITNPGLWLIYFALSLFVAIPVALILGLFSVMIYLRRNDQKK